MVSLTEGGIKKTIEDMQTAVTFFLLTLINQLLIFIFFPIILINKQTTTHLLLILLIGLLNIALLNSALTRLNLFLN